MSLKGGGEGGKEEKKIKEQEQRKKWKDQSSRAIKRFQFRLTRFTTERREKHEARRSQITFSTSLGGNFVFVFVFVRRGLATHRAATSSEPKFMTHANWRMLKLADPTPGEDKLRDQSDDAPSSSKHHLRMIPVLLK